MADGSAVDRVMPADRWAFDADVTDVFDDMLRRCIPQYDVMREAVFLIGSRYVAAETHIVDLGCSRGEALAPFADRFAGSNGLLGVEVSKHMVAAAQERFAGVGSVRIAEKDLRTWYPSDCPASLTLAVLTLQFVPIEHRQRIVASAYDATVPGGALVLVEKVLGADAWLDDDMVDVYLGMKHRNGYTDEQIERKRLSLEGVLVPVTAKWNEDMLRAAGFSRVDCFWRWMNFAGWIAIKAT